MSKHGTVVWDDPNTPPQEVRRVTWWRQVWMRLRHQQPAVITHDPAGTTWWR